ncbi:MAG TPA: hypothetical protein DCQ08_03310 [Amoebophilaceae bacterium]|nr:hypothetical protein [Amoebophilaceae bacterium]
MLGYAWVLRTVKRPICVYTTKEEILSWQGEIWSHLSKAKSTWNKQQKNSIYMHEYGEEQDEEQQACTT